MAVLVCVAGACSGGGAERDESGRIVSGGEVDVFELQEGDCIVFEDIESSVEALAAVPCDEPHEGEVFALVDIDDIEVYPGERELSNRAEVECVSRFADYVGVDLVDSTLFYTYLTPSIRGWQDEDEPDRTVVCFVLSAGGPIEVSARDSGL